MKKNMRKFTKRLQLYDSKKNANSYDDIVLQY